MLRLSHCWRTEAFAGEPAGASLRCCPKSRAGPGERGHFQSRLPSPAAAPVRRCHRVSGAAPRDSGPGWHLHSFSALGSCRRLCEGCRGIHGTQGAGSFPQRVAGEFQPESRSRKKKFIQISVTHSPEICTRGRLFFLPSALPSDAAPALSPSGHGEGRVSTTRITYSKERSEQMDSPNPPSKPTHRPGKRGKLPQAPLVYLPRPAGALGQQEHLWVKGQEVPSKHHLRSGNERGPRLTLSPAAPRAV